MKNSLRVRLTIIFIGLAIGPLVLVGLILAQRSFASEEEQALDLQSQVVSRVSTEMDAFLNDIENDLSLLSGEIRGLEEPDRAQQISLLLGKFSSGPFRNIYEEFVFTNAQGQEQLRVSRLEITSSDQLGSRSGLDEFEQPKASGKIYFSPVWFDEKTGQPLITIAIPLFKLRSVQLNNVLIAHIRFKTVGNLIADLQVSADQTIYVVDSSMRLVAHQDPALSLQNRQFEVPEQAGIQSGLDGTNVVLATDSMTLGDQTFTIVAEKPEAEALKAASNTVFAIVFTTVVALVIAAGAGFLVVRQIVRPIESLATVAQKVSTGDLSQQVEITGKDEIGALANAFNVMTERLRDLIDTLEERIEDRTQALEISNDISRQITMIVDQDDLLAYLINRLQREFSFYHVHIYLIEAESNDLVLAVGSGDVGVQLKSKDHRLKAGQGIVGTVAEMKEAFLSNNVDEVLNFIRNPLLPNTKSELAVPLRKGEQVLGVLDIQGEVVDRFTTQDLSLIQAIADQAAVALDNARLLQETQSGLRDIERLNRRLTGETWEGFAREIPARGYRFNQGVSSAILQETDGWLPPMRQAATTKQLIRQTHPGNGEKPEAEMAVPLMLRGQVIGVLGVKREETPDWAEEEVAAVEAVADQLSRALENARLSKEQEKTIDQLREIDRLKSEFLTSMSHELRTPLNSIIGFADVLLQGIDGDLPDLALNDIRLIHNSGQHLLALINDILDLSKIEAGKMELVRQPLDIKEVVLDVLAASTSLVKNKPVEIVVDMAEDSLPEVYADKLRLNQILLNLVSNASKFTEGGTITIKPAILPEQPDRMRISIIDTGIGIPADKLETIFDRFRQADSSTTRKYGGTGLGLAITLNLVQMHGGELKVKSEENVGSEFYFSIPLAGAVLADPEVEKMASEAAN